MKLMPYIKKGLRLFAKDAGILAISFLVLPIALAMIYGNMQKDLFEGKNHSIKAVKVDFKYNEATVKGSIFKSILEQDEVKSFISPEKEKPEYTVQISDDFKTVQINGQDEGSEQFIMLKNFVTSIANNFNKYEMMQNTISGLNLSDNQRKDLINRILGSINANDSSALIREKLVEGSRTLNSVEYYTISIFSFTSIIMILTLAGYFYKEVKEGILRRSLSTPNNKRTYFIGFLITTYIASLVISCVYIFINRLRGIAFTGNISGLILVILIQSFLNTSVVAVVAAFVKKEATANILMTVLLIVPSIFGGVFFYSELIGVKIIKAIMNSMPNTLILNSYKGLAITGGLAGIQGEIAIMALLSIILLALSFIKIELKWEV